MQLMCVMYCSARLRVYIAQCKYETNPDSCLTPSASYGHGCRGAIVDTMGTLITTNCTCRFTDPDRNAQCEQARRIIQRNNTCTGSVASWTELPNVVQSQNAVAAYFASRQLLPFDFAGQNIQSNAIFQIKSNFITILYPYRIWGKYIHYWWYVIIYNTLIM